IGLLLIAFGIIVYFEFGVVGSVVQSAAMFLFGNLYILLPFFSVFLALFLMIQRKGITFKDRIIQGSILIICSLSIFSHSFLFEDLTRSDAIVTDSVFRETWRILIDNGGIVNRSDALGGGMVGALLFSLFHVLFDAGGAKVAAWVILFIGMILITGKALIPFIFEKGPELKKKFARKRKNKRSSGQRESKRTKRQVQKEESPANEIVATSFEEPPIIFKE
ncbi:cell division protein FtsK, partial [Butyricicoccus sp. 1XD8-22]